MKTYTKVIDYYNNATDDYKFWSKDYNMHFGLAIPNIFNREKMLKKMNSFILSKSNFNKKESAHFIDLGCGCGGTLRQGCEENAKSRITGITLSEWQINKCNSLIEIKNLPNAKVIKGDYHNLPFSNSEFNGGYALESICHSEDRNQVLKEASRVLKKGSVFVVGDGFLKTDLTSTSKLFQKMFKLLCEGWAIPDFAHIDEFKKMMEGNNLKIEEIQDLSWQIAPSVIHSPYVIIKYLLYSLVGKAKLQKQNINNLKGSLMGLIIGLHRKKFSYYLIKAVKI